MGDLIAWVLVLSIGAGLIFVWTIVEMELKSRREARRRRFQSPTTAKSKPASMDAPAKPIVRIVRGYDSIDLFRTDSILRMRELEREITADIKEMERNRSKSDTK